MSSKLWAKITISDEYKTWKRKVRKAFNYRCTNCGENRYNRKNRLHCHHIKPKAKFTNKMFSISNGILLCSKCHIQEHKNMKVEFPEYDNMPTVSSGYLKGIIKCLHFKLYNRRRYSRKRKK